jgi:hypothetical protein
VVASFAILFNGGELWLVVFVAALAGVAGWFMEPFLRDLLADVPGRDGSTTPRDIRER